MSLLALALSILVGLSLGLLGGGGSILTLPILLYAVGMPTKPAIATSLLVVAGASLAALVAHARAGRVAWRQALTFGAASTATAYAAGSVAHFVPAAWLLVGFTAIMLVTGAAMLRGSSPPRGAGRSQLSHVLAAGASVGALTGLVGAGGGFLIVPALTLFAKVDIRRAVGSSLFIITLNSLAGFAGYLGHVRLELSTVAAVTVVAALGSVLGSLLAARVKPAHLRRGFALFVLAMSVWMAARQIAHVPLQQLAQDARLTHLLAAMMGALLALLAAYLRTRTPHPH